MGLSLNSVFKVSAVRPCSTGCALVSRTYLPFSPRGIDVETENIVE